MTRPGTDLRLGPRCSEMSLAGSTGGRNRDPRRLRCDSYAVRWDFCAAMARSARRWRGLRGDGAFHAAKWLILPDVSLRFARSMMSMEAQVSK